MQGAEAGALDDVIGDIIPIVETELFGQVSEEKEANAFSGGCKEAKRLRAYATYQILAQGITFRDHMSTLLQPVCPHLNPHSIWVVDIQQKEKGMVCKSDILKGVFHFEVEPASKALAIVY